jgi:hypothetical protein
LEEISPAASPQKKRRRILPLRRTSESVYNERQKPKMQITVNYGVANSLTRDMPEGATLQDILTNQNIMAVLGASSENVVGKIDGVAQDAGQRLVHGDVVDLETRANSKG